MKYIINCFIVCLADLFSKQYINKNYKSSKRNEIYPNKLYIWNTKNKGIAYNKLEQSPSTVKLITGAITALLGAVFACTVFKPSTPKLFKIGISTALGGALGNFIDRMKNGCVMIQGAQRGRIACMEADKPAGADFGNGEHERSDTGKGKKIYSKASYACAGREAARRRFRRCGFRVPFASALAVFCGV